MFGYSGPPMCGRHLLLDGALRYSFATGKIQFRRLPLPLIFQTKISFFLRVRCSFLSPPPRGGRGRSALLGISPSFFVLLSPAAGKKLHGARGRFVALPEVAVSSPPRSCMRITRMQGKNKQHIVITFRIINAFPRRQMHKNVLSVQGQEIIFPRTRRHKDMWRTNAEEKGRQKSHFTTRYCFSSPLSSSSPSRNVITKKERKSKYVPPEKRDCCSLFSPPNTATAATGDGDNAGEKKSEQKIHWKEDTVFPPSVSSSALQRDCLI